MRELNITIWSAILNKAVFTVVNPWSVGEEKSDENQ
jgi:hypothetical protein